MLKTEDIKRYYFIKKEYCSTCDETHGMLDGGDYIDCWIHHRNNESEDVKKAREDKVEIWDVVNKVWVKKSKYRRTG